MEQAYYSKLYRTLGIVLIFTVMTIHGNVKERIFDRHMPGCKILWDFSTYDIIVTAMVDCFVHCMQNASCISVGYKKAASRCRLSPFHLNETAIRCQNNHWDLFY